MRLTIIKDEASVADLADRLFAKLTPASRKKFEAAILKANPQLARAGALQPGTVVHLPDIPGLKPRAAEAGRDPVGDVIAGLKEAVDGYRDRLAKNLEAARDDAINQRTLLAVREVAATIKTTDGAPELAKTLIGALNERRRVAEEQAKGLDALFKTIAKDLDSIR
jgi:phage tail protein X